MFSFSLATTTRAMSLGRRIAAACVGIAAFGIQAVHAQGANRLENVQANSLPGNKVEVTLRLSDTAPQPLVFTVDNPARIALDLPNTSVAMTSRRVDVKQGVLDTVNVAEANGRTRVVLNVDSLVAYETRLQGNTIVVTLGTGGSRGGATTTAAAASTAATPRPVSAVSGSRNINNVDFRRGSDGSG